MSDFSLDDDLVLEYIAESREHLLTIEADLLAMEQAGAEIDETLVNRVFRAAHSIKGGAGFFDLVQIKELAHKTESVLDLVRSRILIPGPEIINTLLLAFDKLRDLLESWRESNEAIIQGFTAALERIALQATPHAAGTQPAEVVIPAGTSAQLTCETDDLEQAHRHQQAMYAIEIDLLHDVQRRGKSVLDLLNKLVDSGELVDTVFDLASAGTLDAEPCNRLIVRVLYGSALDIAGVAGLLGIPSEQVSKADHLTAEPEETIDVVKSEPQEEHVVASVPNPAAAVAEERSNAKNNAPASSGDATIRLQVCLLDSLMTLAGELVLGRNQLNEAVRTSDLQGIRAGAHRMSLITSEMQEAVALTRMQPVSTLFAKFPRLVRDLANELSKEVHLKLEGGEVELDKTILEGLSDPLTHMVRNAVDHGIEVAAVRLKAGKAAAGTVTLRARHQAGQVVIEIIDDGRGLLADKVARSAVTKGLITSDQLAGMSEPEKQALIFLPGVSTAEKLSNVSGRGVGMDVVKTNLDKLGGKIEIESGPGRGSAFRIKLPLTLAIIPSLLLSEAGERFAIPQINVGELVRIPADQIRERIDRAGDAEVVLLRDRLVPLVRLGQALGTPVTGTLSSSRNALNIVLVETGSFDYGLVVEELHDTVEIVVKPLGRHLQILREYAGATILGDGQVALILDAAGLAQRAGLTQSTARIEETSSATFEGEKHSLLIFHNAPGENCAVPIDLVTRVERVRPEQIEGLGGRRTMQHCGQTLPIVMLHDVASVGELDASQQWVVIVFESASRHFGLVGAEPLDMIESCLQVDTVTLRQKGIAGSSIVNGKTTLLMDIYELADTGSQAANTHRDPRDLGAPPSKQNGAVLVAEDSDFFRDQIQRMIEAVGYRVIAAEDGQSAWEMLDRYGDQVAVVTTDVEMPRLDGIGLARRIRADSRFADLPVIALSALAADEEVAEGLAAGITEYQVKLDRNDLLESITRAMDARAGRVR